MQKIVGESHPACEDCSLPDEEGKDMKVDILASFQSPWIKAGFQQPNFSNLINVFASVIVIVFPLKLVIKSDRITVTKLVPSLDGT